MFPVKTNNLEKLCEYDFEGVNAKGQVIEKLGLSLLSSNK